MCIVNWRMDPHTGDNRGGACDSAKVAHAAKQHRYACTPTLADRAMQLFFYF